MRVAVVGSGPAGLIAAEMAALDGHDVTLYEQHRSLGRKFLLAGRSGLNLTHSEPIDMMLARFQPLAPQLEGALRAFDADDLRRWSAALGEPTFVGSSGRVFPHSHRATPLLRAWLQRLDTLGVVVRTQHRWASFDAEFPVFDRPGASSTAVGTDATILACGGPSWPRVGGDGSWAHTLAASGVNVAPFGPANCGVLVAWSETTLARHEGHPLKNIAVSVGGGAPVRGDIVITRGGLEGGPVYAVARHLRDDRAATLDVNLMPDLTDDGVRRRLAKRRSGATQTSWLRSAGLSAAGLSLLRDVTDNALPDDAAAMAQLVRSVPLPVAGLAGLDRAISSSGGVRFSELDDRFMVRAKPGTFVAGEMLDWEAPTGGYLLQGCFSTGVAAARGVSDWAAEARPAFPPAD